MNLGSTPASFTVTDRRHGDLGPSAKALDEHELDKRRRRVVDRPWSWLDQVHGSGVVVIDKPGCGAGQVGDALVSSDPGACLAVFTADCVPVALAGPDGVMGAVHAGWKGVLAGVVEAGVAAMRSLGADVVEAAIGPCIRAECYEFSPGDLTLVEDRLGSQVRSVTSSGRPALDMVAAVSLALGRAGAQLVDVDPHCTGCSPCYFSYRARRDTARQALVVWRD